MHLLTVIIITLNYGGNRASNGSSGCGLCDKTSFCNSGGQCCTVQEDSYQKWSDGTARHRYSCTITKLIGNGRQTKYLYPIDVSEGTYQLNVWMISDCPTRYSNQTVKQLCESPGLYDDFENVVPVSDSVVHFRNKFCAYCNGWNESLQLTYWFTELYCDANLSSSTNMLAAIVRRMCNLFFRPPHNIPTEECLVKQETFKNCNITVQRSHSSNITLHNRYPHTDVIDRKTCRLDPNPKHHLCYDCDEAYQWNITENVCPISTDDHFSFDMVPFTDMLDVTAIITAPPKDIPSDNCDSSLQFYDTSKMICRELWCDEYRYLLNGECVVARNMELACKRVFCNYRFLLFVKLIPDSVNIKTDLTVDDIIVELPNELYQFFRQIVIEADPLTDIPDSVIESFRIYKKSAPTLSHSFGEYLIVQLIVDTKNYTIDFLSYMYTKIHNSSLFSFHEISFSSELVSYEFVYHHDLNDGWHFDLKTGPSEENVLEQIPFNITLSNTNSEWLRFNAFKKVSICPYIKLKSREFSVQIENDGFLILGNNVTTARFSIWEFDLPVNDMEWNDNIISLCASDYETRFNNPSKLNPNLPITENVNSVKPMFIQLGWLIGLSTGCLLIT